STYITVAVPYGVKSDFIKVVTPYGEVTSATKFEVPAPAFVTGIEFEPSSAGAGETVTLYGQYFTGVTGVLFNGVAADPTTIKFGEGEEDSKITVTVPNGAASGQITIVTPAGQDVSTNTFTVLGPQIIAFDDDNNAETPAVEFSPAGGAVGTTVTIYGEYFTAVNEVLFNGVKATFTVINDNQVTALVPLGAGTGPITVISPANQDISATVFDVPAPQFAVFDGVDSQFKPTTAGPGMQITLYGANLASASSVIFLGSEGGEGVEGVIVTPLTSDTELVVTVPANATTGPIQIVAPGDKVATSEQIFTFVPAPTIATVGTTEGGLTYSIVGKEVTITGTNFETATQVVFGGVTITPYNADSNAAGFSVNGNTITFTIPETAKTGSVTVKTLGGEATWAGPFEVIYAPVASITPTKGPIGQKITLTGEHLKYVSEVVFLGDAGTEDDNLPIKLTTPNESDNKLVVTVPAGALTGNLLVINPAGQVETSEFEVIRTPVVLTFTPVVGLAGTVVAVTGYNFVKEGDITVTFAGSEGAIPAATADVTSDTTLTTTVPAGAITGLITISNSNGFGVSPANFTIIQKPTITNIAPTKGTEGSTVVIKGTEFLGDNITVTFLGTEEGNDETVATTITVDSETQITATVPVGAVTGKLMVANAAGASEPSDATYTVVRTPEIISFNPVVGKVSDKVTITGWLLNQVTGVDFNDTPAQFTYNTDGTITATVPAEATTGPISINVNETEAFRTAEVFTVIPAPTIIAFSPVEGGVAGTVVTITGTNFRDVTAVSFNGIAADMSTVQVNETFDVLTVTVPFAATTGKIKIVAAAGEAESTDNFIVPVPANITFTNNTSTPTTSYAYQLVTVRGQYFTNASAVTFNGKPATIIGTVTKEVGEEGVETGFQLITVKAPFDGGTGKVAVTTPAGTGTSAADYTVIEPIIATISATEGYVGQTVIKITGELFTQYWNESLNDGAGGVEEKAPVVKFSGAQVTATTYSATEITVTVPNGARSGSLTVVSGSGESEPMPFTVLVPVLSTVEPTAVYAGETVTITGTNFINITGVSYGGIAITDYTINLTNEEDGTGTITFTAPVVNHDTPNTLSVTSSSGTGTSTALTVYRPVISSVVQTGTVSDTKVYAGVNTVTIKGARFDEYFNGATVAKAIPTVTFAGPSSTRVTGTITSATYSTTEEGEDVLEVAVPANAVAGTIRVQSGSGTGESNGSLTIIGAPTIASFSTYAGVVGTTFVIRGSNFDDATEVKFLGIEGETDEKTAIYTVTSSTRISVTVPQDATIGKISVTTPYNGSTTATSTQVFRVVKAPIIHDFVAKEGPAGYIVTITGENLIDVEGKLKVFFKGHGGSVIPAPTGSQVEIEATVSAENLVTAREIKVTVPANAITGVIRVANTAGVTTTADATETTVDEFVVTSPVIVRFEREDGNIITSSNPARLLEKVIVKGYQLTNIGTIKIGTSSVTSFYEDNENSLGMFVPLNASRNYVTITALGVTETSNPEYLEIVRPTITATPTALSFKTTVGTAFDVKSYTVEAKNLAIGRDLTLSMTGDVTFQISVTPESTEEGSWTRAMILTPDAAGNLTQVVSVRNTSTEIGKVLTGSIANSSLEAAAATVTLDSEIVPLPVELIAFNGVKQNNGVLLTWATASEQDNDFFEVEMTEDPKAAFKAVGKVKSKVNNSSIRQDYQFSHKGNFTGTRYYRLKQVDLGGTFEYSKVVAVSADGINLAAGPKVAPNPITPESKLIFTAAEAGKLNVTVVNMNGTRVYSQAYDIEAGENRIELNLSNSLPTGVYILMTEFNGKVEQVKLL
ncbi:hypothetical protein OB13_08585, partial [Pontibacter sp. HJ8]